jgi:uncharacterized surface protein with fasciclin (FAS1) repeats
MMLAGGALPLLLAACGTIAPRSSGPLPEDGTIDILSLLAARPDAKIFNDALKRSGLAERITLANGPATLFVPNDTTIEALPPANRAILTDPKADQAKLREAVGSLIASGQLRLESIAVRSGQINTWAPGHQLRVTGAPAPTAKIQRAVLANGRTAVTGPVAGFARADILGSNGVIHILDTALLPTS